MVSALRHRVRQWNRAIATDCLRRSNVFTTGFSKTANVPKGSTHPFTSASTSDSLNTFNTLKLISGVSAVPHPKKKKTGGEDSHFVSACGRALGVSDGVGGWAELGVDAGEYSRELCSNMDRFVSETGNLDPRDALQSAYSATQSIGTATACVITLDGSTLKAANLGDSGFMVLRKAEGHWKMMYQTAEQQHYFNCPKQLGTKSRDRPSDAQLLSLPLAPGDMLLAATDGFFDNLFPEDVCKIINSKRRHKYNGHNLPTDVVSAEEELLQGALTSLARRLCRSTLEVAKSETRRTPFAVNAGKAGFFYEGGKVDDITIVASIAVPSDE